MNTKSKRNLTPSRSVAVGTPVGGAAGVLLTVALQALGVPVTAELAAALGTVIGAAVAYFTRGGRKGEAQ